MAGGKPGQPLVVDTLRYTLVMQDEVYAQGVSAVRAALAADGVACNDMKNFWKGTQMYRGINDIYIANTDVLEVGDLYFELQFHTPASLEAKLSVHGSKYAVFRAEDISQEEKVKTYYELVEVMNRVPIPSGAEDLPKPVTRSPPVPLEPKGKGAK